MSTVVDEQRTDEALPSGSIVHWATHKHGQVMVTCGLCGRKRVTRLPQGKLKAKWTGLCKSCVRIKFSQDIKLPSGSTIHWSERDSKRPNRVAVTCGKCGVKRLARPYDKQRGAGRTGLCWACAHGVHIHDETLPSGTIAHWPVRDPSDPKHKIGITCHGCSQQKFAQRVQVRDPNWSGLCHDCVLQRVNPKRFIHDVKLPTGSVIHWGERDPSDRKKVMVTCGKCKQKRLMRPDGRNRTGLCLKCGEGKRKYLRKVLDQVLPSGSVIHWGERDQTKKRVAVRCGACGKEHQATASAARKPKFRGLHRECYHNGGLLLMKSREVEEIPGHGSLIEWPQLDKGTVPVKCGMCKEWRRVDSQTLSKRREKYTGLCRPCSVKYQRARATRTDGCFHPSGTLVNFAVRHPGIRAKVQIICHDCQKPKFVWMNELRRPSWSGLCHECIKERPPYNKLLGEKRLESGSVVFLGHTFRGRRAGGGPMRRVRRGLVAD